MTDKKHDDDQVPFVSEVIGEGHNARRIVQVGAWKLTAWAEIGNDEPRIRDLDLGQRLAFARPRVIRELIARMIADGKLKDVHVRRAVRRGLFAGKTQGQQAVDEFWLTEAQALKVAAKSETEVADALLDEMIHVYMLARKGLLPDRGPSPEAVALAVMALLRPELNDALAPLMGRLGALDGNVLTLLNDAKGLRSNVASICTVMEQIAAQNGQAGMVLRTMHESIVAQRSTLDALVTAAVRQHDLSADTNERLVELAARDGRITPGDVTAINGQIDTLIDLWMALHREKKPGSVRSARSSIVQELLERIDWTGSGRTVANMTASRVPLAKNHLDYEIRTARKTLRKRRENPPPTRPKGKQGDLFNKPN